MVFSMTGFGRAQVEQDGLVVTAEMKSVNHRFLEMSIRLPKQLAPLEEQVRKTVAAQVRRGRVELSVVVEGEALSGRRLHVDWGLFAAYKQMLEEASHKFQLQNSVTVSQILAMPEVASVQEAALSAAAYAEIVGQAVEQAAQQLKDMREREGLRLQEDVQQQAAELASRVQAIMLRAPEVVQRYRQRLQDKLQELGAPAEEPRLLTEIVLFAERADIQEELVRLQSHLAQMEETLAGSEPSGRKLDFLMQEMHREINTIGAKANDVIIAKHVVEMKNHLEKIREQVQNIE